MAHAFGQKRAGEITSNFKEGKTRSHSLDWKVSHMMMDWLLIIPNASGTAANASFQDFHQIAAKPKYAPQVGENEGFLSMKIPRMDMADQHLCEDSLGRQDHGVLFRIFQLRISKPAAYLHYFFFIDEWTQDSKRVLFSKGQALKQTSIGIVKTKILNDEKLTTFVYQNFFCN